MIEAGEIWLADLRGARRRRVLVLSDPRWIRATGRVLVAPEMPIEPEEVRVPWRLPLGNATFAVDHARTVSEARLLERVEQTPRHLLAAARRAARQMS